MTIATLNIYFPRIAKDGTDRGMRVLSQERMAGKRAPYHIYYRKNGKLLVDPIYCQTPQDAIAWFKEATGMLSQGWRKVEVLGVVSTCLPDDCNLTY